MRLERNRKICMDKQTTSNMKVHVYSGEISAPDFKYDTEENIHALLGLIEFLPDSDIISFSVQDLKKFIGIKPESSMDFSLK